MRKAKLIRKTKETEIKVNINIDGNGNYKSDIPIGFLDHMLNTFARYALIDLDLSLKGDLNVDQHHSIEDLGISIGDVIRKALGDKKGISRAGFFIMPMDEALSTVCIDIGGRPYLQYNVKFKRRFCGDLDLDTIEDFFQGLTLGLQANIVVRAPFGRSDHHKIEAIFKAFGKAMLEACSYNARENKIPSTKGVI